MNKEIVVLAARTQDALENGADVEDTHCQTVAEAKERAKYYLTKMYMRASESTVQLGYSQVLVNGKCEYDYFANGINPRDLHEDACKDGIDMDGK
jgi:hypothetical protein